MLYEAGPRGGASESLVPFLRSACPDALLEPVRALERFPRSTAVDARHRRALEREGGGPVRPWDDGATLREVHRRGDYPRESRRRDAGDADPRAGVGRWPEVLRRCVEGGATLALGSFGAALFYLQRALIGESRRRQRKACWARVSC